MRHDACFPRAGQYLTNFRVEPVQFFDMAAEIQVQVDEALASSVIRRAIKLGDKQAVSDTKTNYEIENPEVQATLKAIATRIAAGLPSNLWGFMLMVFEYGTPGNPGANFYISSADRADVSVILREWLARQPEAKSGLVEHDPNHPVTRAAHDHWYKFVALLLHKYGAVLGDVVFTSADIAGLEAAYAGSRPSVVVEDRDNRLRLRLVDEPEAVRLAQTEGGKRI